MTAYNPPRIARIAWEACREFDHARWLASSPDASTPVPWDELPASGRDLVIAQVVAAAGGAPASELHREWRHSMSAGGWTYGLSFSPAARAHPDHVPWERLGHEAQTRYELFREIVCVLSDRPSGADRAALLRFPADATAAAETHNGVTLLHAGQAGMLAVGTAEAAGFVASRDAEGEYVQADALSVRVMFPRGHGQLFSPRQLGGVVADWLDARGVNLDPAGLGDIALEAALYDTGGRPAEPEPEPESQPEAGMAAPVPSTGRIVHYVSHGTPDGEYGRACRAAIITQVHADDPVPEHGVPYAGLFVANPTGLFVKESVRHDPGRPAGEDTALCYGLDYAGGTWHWLELAGQ